MRGMLLLSSVVLSGVFVMRTTWWSISYCKWYIIAEYCGVELGFCLNILVLNSSTGTVLADTNQKSDWNWSVENHTYVRNSLLCGSNESGK